MGLRLNAMHQQSLGFVSDWQRFVVLHIGHVVVDVTVGVVVDVFGNIVVVMGV